MRPGIRFIFIFMAYGIALLHTAIPHHHDNVSDRQVTISSTGCHFNHFNSGFLQMIFSTDLGYGHLEIFKKGAEPRTEFAGGVTSLIAVVAPQISFSAPASLDSDHLKGFVEKLKKRQLLFATTSFRAPPRVA